VAYGDGPRVAEPSHSGPLVPIERQLKCVEREIGYRREVYARRVTAGKMTKEKAADEIAAMIAVLHTLQQVAQGERLI
jgi:hypothetical protein